MFSKKFVLGMMVLTFMFLEVHAQGRYFPPRGKDWQTISPKGAFFNESKLQEAVQFALDNEYDGDYDLRIAILKGFSHEPYHHLAGPTKKRGTPAGVIIRKGFIVAQWGDVNRVDMTFSVTKSYLSTVAGLALKERLISDVHDKVGDYVWDGTFQGS